MGIQAKAETILRSRGFVGIPLETFEQGGREQFIYLLQAGLQPGSKVVDLGCGVLRAGYWLIRFLEEGCYCAIEPHRERLEIGIHHILEPEILELKRPRFDTNATFDTSVFRERFDFFLAYSVWTHACKRQIRTMLDSFVRDSTQTAVFLVTFLPSSLRHPDYQGDAWFGTSHESDVPGCVHHSFRWIQTECKLRSLTALRIGIDRTHSQTWIRITRQSAVEPKPVWRRKIVRWAKRF